MFFCTIEVRHPVLKSMRITSFYPVCLLTLNLHSRYVKRSHSLCLHTGWVPQATNLSIFAALFVFKVFALTSKGRGEAAILTTATDDLGWVEKKIKYWCLIPNDIN